MLEIRTILVRRMDVRGTELSGLTCPQVAELDLGEVTVDQDVSRFDI